MADQTVTNELMYEQLKTIRREIADLRVEVREYRADNLALKGHVLGLMQADLNKDAAIAEVRTRLERVETRLNLREGDA